MWMLGAALFAAAIVVGFGGHLLIERAFRRAAERDRPRAEALAAEDRDRASD